jgi:hypothetical protein
LFCVGLSGLNHIFELVCHELYKWVLVQVLSDQPSDQTIEPA